MTSGPVKDHTMTSSSHEKGTTTTPSPTPTVNSSSDDVAPKEDTNDSTDTALVRELEQGQSACSGGEHIASKDTQEPKPKHWLQETEHVIPKNNLWIVFSGLMFSVYL